MEKTKKDLTMENEKIAMNVSKKSIEANVLLSAIKLFAGIFAHSGAMVSDAVHSLSDVLSTFIVIIGVKIANREADEEHPYGHERFECVASIVLAAMLLFTGIMIGYGGIKKIREGSYTSLEVPGILALLAAVLSIVIKEGMFQYTVHFAKKIRSDALMADAWHHRSDALSSVGALFGILMARFGYPIADPIASIVICLFIGKASYDIFMSAIDKMVDRSCDEETLKKMEDTILSVDGVEKNVRLNTRVFGSRVYTDVDIACDGKLSLTEAHDIAQTVHDRIEEEFPEVKHCMVHVDPLGE